MRDPSKAPDPETHMTIYLVRPLPVRLLVIIRNYNLPIYPECVNTFDRSHAGEEKKIIILKLLHQILPHRPHAGSFPINVHWNRREQQTELNAAQGEKHSFRAVGLKPVVEEEGEDEAVKDVYIDQQNITAGKLSGVRTHSSKNSSSPTPRPRTVYKNLRQT